MNKGFMSSLTSLTVDWPTPKGFYDILNKEFSFNDDPCPIGGTGGLDRDWGSVTFVNPPYGVKGKVSDWIKKGIEEFQKGKIVVFLLPVRSDTKWFHTYILPYATEIRFIKGRLHFGEYKNAAPFPSMIVIFK